MEINQRMKEARTKAGYSQAQIAEKLGKMQQQYGRYETGQRELPINKITDFCRA